MRNSLPQTIVNKSNLFQNESDIRNVSPSLTGMLKKRNRVRNGAHAKFMAMNQEIEQMQEKKNRMTTISPKKNRQIET